MLRRQVTVTCRALENVPYISLHFGHLTKDQHTSTQTLNPFVPVNSRSSPYTITPRSRSSRRILSRRTGFLFQCRIENNEFWRCSRRAPPVVVSDDFRNQFLRFPDYYYGSFTFLFPFTVWLVRGHRRAETF